MRHIPPMQPAQKTDSAGLLILVGPGGKGAAISDFDGDGWADLELVHRGLQIQTSEVDGTYLHGHGAVLSVTLPPVARVLATAPVKPTSPPLTQWDRPPRQVPPAKP